MLGLLVPILINYLVDTNLLPSSSKYIRSLHDYALQHLIKIGPKYPQDFRMIMSQSPNLRNRLETSIRENAQLSNKSSTNSMTIQDGQRTDIDAEPKIKLKTDFSNFKG